MASSVWSIWAAESLLESSEIHWLEKVPNSLVTVRTVRSPCRVTHWSSSSVAHLAAPVEAFHRVLLVSPLADVPQRFAPPETRPLRELARRQRVSLSRFVSPGFKPAERIMGLPREHIGRPAGPGMTSDPQVQPNIPGQDGWLMALEMPIIGRYGPKYAARRSLEISWDESDAISPSLKSQDGAGGGRELFFLLQGSQSAVRVAQLLH